jgi:hypothetical protein
MSIASTASTLIAPFLIAGENYYIWLNNGGDGGGSFPKTKVVFVEWSKMGNPIFMIEGPYYLRSSCMELEPRSRDDETWEIEEA